jgi:hypothetical protein
MTLFHFDLARFPPFVLEQTRKTLMSEGALREDVNIDRREEMRNCYLIPKEWKGLSTKLSSIRKQTHQAH